jgi:hypothetical protein
MLEPNANGPPSPGRPFPWFCPKCRKKEVRPAMMPYRAERLWDGHIIAVEIPQLEVPTCANCGELVFNYTAEEQILHAIRAQAQVSHRADERGKPGACPTP